MDDYERGFEAGYMAGWRTASGSQIPTMDRGMLNERIIEMRNPAKTKRKKPQKGKAKLLTDMTAPKWNKYKKGSGKKTYVQIRAQVSRSMEYKRACKRKGFK